jgi:peptidoglycan/LPS O-acetylase OafA/YrhL
MSRGTTLLAGPHGERPLVCAGADGPDPFGSSERVAGATRGSSEGSEVIASSTPLATRYRPAPVEGGGRFHGGIGASGGLGTYVPALDGLRALAVMAVVAFHLGFGWAPGGFLGVSLFFTLSGFLITGLLLDEHASTGRIDLAAFWGRRMRRLTPAALACLAVVLVSAHTLLGLVEIERVPGDVVAAALSMANWRFAAGGESYADLFVSGPSPVLHFWSLAIEEQFYLAFPLLVAGVLALRRVPLAPVLTALLVASVGVALFAGVGDVGYYATHVRAAELLVGALLAFAVRSRRPADGRALTTAGMLGSASLVALVGAVHQSDAWLYRGGFAGLAVVVWCPLLLAATGHGPFPRVVGLPAMAAIGRRSYGIYLYHWPVFTLLTPARLGLGGWPARAVQLGLVAALTEVSYRGMERPIRERRLLVTTATCRYAFAGLLAAVVAVAALVPLPRPPQMTFVAAPNEATLLAAPAFPTAPRTAPQRVARPASAATPLPVSSATTSTSTTSPPPPPVRVVVLGNAPALGAAVAEFLPERAELADHTMPGCLLVLDSLAGDPGRPACPSGPVTVAGADVVIVGVGETEAVALATTIGAARERMGELIRLYQVIDPTLAALADAAPRVLLADTLDDAALAAVPDGATAALMLRHSMHETALASTNMTDHTASGLSAALAEAVEPVVVDQMRVMVIGDSTAYGVAAGVAGSGQPISVLWAGRLACPLADATEIELLHSPKTTAECPGIADWAAEAADFAPHVILAVSSIAEPTNHRYAGSSAWRGPGDPEYIAAHDQWLAELTAIAGGARVVVATAPHAAGDTAAWVDPADVDRWNAQIDGWDAAGRVEVLDYAGMLAAAEAAAGHSLRPDGAHLDDATVALLGGQIATALAGR